MKVFWLAIVSFLWTFSNCPPTEKTIVQNIPLHHRTLTIKSALEGAVEVVYVDQLAIEVETTLSYSTKEANVLDYAISAGHFKLVTDYSWKDACLTLQEQRINTVIYTDGNVFEPMVSYRLKVPTHLNFIETTTAALKADCQE